MDKIIIVDEKRCLGCKQCMIECAMAHTDASTLAEALCCDSPLQPRIHVEPAGQFGMPLQCRHCEDAPCLTICPTEAIHRTSEMGPVLLDQKQCIGCKFCVIVCPFGVIDMSRDGKAAIKCDMCIERTEAGQDPACVAGCPTGALQLRELDEYLSERRRRVAKELTAASGQTLSIGAETPHGSDES